MLYDENGVAYVEPPLLPEEYHTFCIVKDYRRMSCENERLKAQVKRLQESLKRLNMKQYAQQKLLGTHADMLRRSVKQMKANGIQPSKVVMEYGRDKQLWK